MPHQRLRYAEVLIQRALRHSAIVGILGQRQVGKTTLLEKAAAEYVTLDRERNLGDLEADPLAFLAQRKLPFAIDEAQLAPRLFPVLKEQVRVHKGVGQYLLSGSVRFTSRRAIRESLTGRIANIEVIPFSFSEARERPLPNLLQGLSRVKSQKSLEQVFLNVRCQQTDFEEYLLAGGLPGIAFFRGAAVRSDRLQTHIDTLLNRDIRLIQSTTLPYSALRDAMRYLAENQGKPFGLKAAVSASQISAVTFKRLLYAFEALFLVRAVSSVGDRTKRTYFFEDQGFATWLARPSLKAFEGPQDIVRGLYANLRHELHYRPEWNGNIYQYRSKHDVEVPLVFESAQTRVGVLATLETTPRPKTLGSAKAFLKKNPGFCVVIAYSGREPVYRAPGLYWVPYWFLLG